jgi:hypothetical protein
VEANYSLTQLPLSLSSPINLNEQLTRFTIATPVNSSPNSTPIKNNILNCLCPYDCSSSNRNDEQPSLTVFEKLTNRVNDKRKSEIHIFHSN